MKNLRSGLMAVTELREVKGSLRCLELRDVSSLMVEIMKASDCERAVESTVSEDAIRRGSAFLFLNGGYQ